MWSAGADDFAHRVCYGGATDPMPMLTLFDKQIQLRMGKANVKWWVDSIMPLLLEEDVLGVENFATHRLGLEEAPQRTRTFRRSRTARLRSCSGPERLSSMVSGSPASRPSDPDHRLSPSPRRFLVRAQAIPCLRARSWPRPS